MISYAIPLAFCSICTLCASWAERICALVLICNFIANESFVRLTGMHTPWGWFLFTDTCALLVVTIPLAGRIGAILAATYATQLVMHLSYGMSKHGDQDAYWQSLTAMAFLQLLVLFVGSMGHGCIRLNSRLHRRIPMDTGPHPASIRETRGEDQ